MVVVFVNGSLFDGHRYAGPGAAVVEGDRLTGGPPSAPTPARRPWTGPGRAPAWSTWRAACSSPASSTPTCTRSRAGSSGCAATCPRGRAATTTSPRFASTPRPTPTLPGSWAAAGRCPPSRAALPRPPTWTASSRTVRCSCPTATITAPGSTAVPWRSPGSTSTPPIRPTAGSSATTPGGPSGTLHEGATSLVSRHVPRTTGEDYYAALLTGQAYLHSLGVTSWQDAIVGAYSGMDDPASTYTKAAANGDLRSDVVGRPVVGAAARHRAGRGPGRPPGGDDRRTVPGHQREDHAGRRGRELHGRDVRAVPRPLRPPDRQRGPLVRRGRCPPRRGRRARRRRVPGARARIGDRAARETLDAFEGTDPARRHHIAHLQLVHPDDVARFARLGVAANIQMLWACLDDQMVDLTIPFLGEERARLAVPVRRPPPGRRPAGRRQRLAGEHARPAGRDPHRGQPHGVRRVRQGGPANRSCPIRRWTWRRRSRRTPPARRG